MKTAFQKDDELLADIAATRQHGDSKLWWLGQSGFLFIADGTSTLFDPYLSDSLTRKYATTDKPHVRITERVIDPSRLTGIDIITSSHNHTDHLDAETLLPIFAANPDAKFVIPRANREFILNRLGKVADWFVELDAGESVKIGKTRWHGIAAAHNEVERDENGNCRFLGYVVETGSITAYHSGDTLWHNDLARTLKAHQIDLAMHPINGNKPERRVAGNLNGIEAAQLAKEIHTGIVVPHHFDMFEFNTADPTEFEDECRRIGQRHRTLKNGEGMSL